MANTNVKFYRLSNLPDWNDAYQGIFIHSNSEKYKGLYFGGVTGWEKLSNVDQNTANEIHYASIDNGVISFFNSADTQLFTLNISSYVGGVVDTKIGGLTGSATIAIVSDGEVTLKSGITEIGGKIAIDTTGADIKLKKVATTAEAEDVFKTTNSTAVYNTTATEISDTWKGVVNGNKLADGDSVDVDLNRLDNKIAGLADELIADEKVINNTFEAVKSSLGLEDDFTLDITGTNFINGNDTNVKSALVTLDTKLQSVSASIPAAAKDAKLKIGDVQVFSANADTDSTITIDSNAFTYDSTNGLKIVANTAVSSSNKLATMSDISSISGAMHYKGTIVPKSDSDATAVVSGTDAWVTRAEAGDTYVVTKACKKDNVVLEAGDMVVFTSGSGFNVVQTNMTIGIDNGQFAKNDGVLADKQILIASANGIKSSGYNVTNIASEATSLSATGSGTDTIVTVSDTLSVGGTAQTANSFKVKGGDKLTASLDESDTIVLSHDTQLQNSSTSTGSVTLSSTGYSGTFDVPSVSVDSYGHVTGKDVKTYTISLTTATMANCGTTDGLATALDVKNYVNNHETVVKGENSVNVEASTDTDSGANIYTADLIWMTTFPTENQTQGDETANTVI